MKIDRLMTIIVILLNRKKVTARELAERFEVSIRTIYRDIDTIDLAGIPIISYPGQNGGFGIMENYKLSHQLLTPSNLCSLMTTLSGINQSLDDSELDASIEKFRTLIPEDQADAFNFHKDQLIIDMPSWANSTKEKETIKKLRAAISQHHLVKIEYRNYQSQVSSRVIEPMTIIFKGYTWHLFAYCRLKADFRVFKISRIKHIQIEEEKYSRRASRYQDIIASKEESQTLHITFKFQPQVRSRVEDIFTEDNIQVLKDGTLIVTASFPNHEWVYSLILSFGEHVEILGPELVKHSIISSIKSMSEKY